MFVNPTVKSCRRLAEILNTSFVYEQLADAQCMYGIQCYVISNTLLNTLKMDYNGNIIRSMMSFRMPREVFPIREVNGLSQNGAWYFHCPKVDSQKLLSLTTTC